MNSHYCGPPMKSDYTGPVQLYTGPIPSSQEIERLLEFAKKDVFLNNNAAFLGSLLCSHELQWVTDGSIKTAATDGITIWWEVVDFLRCSAGERGWTILHEIWHTGLMHALRRGNRDRKLWNIACDYRINNNLIYDGCKLLNNGWWVFDTSLDDDGILSEEEIYDLLFSKAIPVPVYLMGGDLLDNSKNPADPAKILAAVVRAVQAAEMAGKAGNLPSTMMKVLKTFLEPKIPWRSVLYQWMTDLIDELEFTWRQPSRRYQDMYMPSHEEPEGRLDHLVFIEDVSGSIQMDDHIRFNSEVKYVKDTLKPKKLTLLQFDTRITYEKVFTEDEPFEQVEIHGWDGGTDLQPVHDWIEKNKPKAAIIFTDLDCAPMKPLSEPIPVIWAAVRNQNATVPFGKLIHIADD